MLEEKNKEIEKLQEKLRRIQSNKSINRDVKNKKLVKTKKSALEIKV